VFKVYELLPAETLRALGFRPGRKARVVRPSRRKRKKAVQQNKWGLA
jgi:hypothetical protein